MDLVDEIVKHAAEEYAVITGAPVAFVLAVLTVIVMTYMVMRWYFRGQIAAKDARIEAKEERIQLRDDLLKFKDAQITHLQQSSVEPPKRTPDRPEVESGPAERTKRETASAAYIRLMTAAREACKTLLATPSPKNRDRVDEHFEMLVRFGELNVDLLDKSITKKLADGLDALMQGLDPLTISIDPANIEWQHHIQRFIDIASQNSPNAASRPESPVK
jgi:hypothetical protein